MFLRSNADRFAIRAMTTPWSQKRRLRILGPSDLDLKMHISSPVLHQKSLSESTNEFTVQSERCLDALPTLLPNRSHSSRTHLQHLNISTESAVPQVSPVAQPSRAIASQPVTQYRPTYSIYPTSASAIVRTSTSTTTSQGTDLPIQPPPPFSRAHQRGFSGQSSATVQIGFRLSFLHRTLEPVQQEPASPSLHLPLQLTSSSRPSSTSSSVLFTQPMNHYHDSTNEVLPIPKQPGKAQISDQVSMNRSEESSPFGPIGETTTTEFVLDDSLAGTTKPLPPVPLTLREKSAQPRTPINILQGQSRPF